jgi:hypothetical protein
VHENQTHSRDRVQLKLCCFCESEDEDWRHVLSCPGTCTTIKRNASWDNLKSTQAHFDIPLDIWNTIEHGLQYFNNHQGRKYKPRHIPPINGSFLPRDILLNDAFALQFKIGWRHFFKGRISNKWGILLTPKIKTDVMKAFERAMITSLWIHSLQLWEFINNDESHKEEIRSVT